MTGVQTCALPISGGVGLVAPAASLKGVVGPETDALALTAADLNAGTFLGLTQPVSAAKLDTLLAKQEPPLVAEDVADWRVVAPTRALIDRLKQARVEGTLAGTGAYRDATSGLPAAALASVYVDGAALTSALDKRAKTGTGPVPGLGRVSWLAGAVTAEPHGLRLELRVKGDEIEATPFTAELPVQVPAGVVLYVGFKGLDATLDELRRSPALTGRLGAAAKLLGGVLDDVIALFKEEGALYARSLPSGPELTLVLQVTDEAAAAETLGKLATLASALQQKLPERTQVVGVTATKITVGKLTLYYAVFDGKLVVSTALSGFRGLRAATPRLADSQAWQQAVAGTGMPDRTAGILYADPARALALVRDRKSGV